MRLVPEVGVTVVSVEVYDMYNKPSHTYRGIFLGYGDYSKGINGNETGVIVSRDLPCGGYTVEVCRFGQCTFND